VTRCAVAAWSNSLTKHAPDRPSGSRNSKNGSVVEAMASQSAAPISEPPHQP
jgi:hypothetical protein